MITVLSTLGVPDETFIELQENMLDSLSRIFASGEEALEVVLRMPEDADSKDGIIEMIEAGFDVADEPFLREQLHCIRRKHLRVLERKTRIFVPHAAFLLGIMDETGTLEYGEVFIQICSPETNYETFVPVGCDIVVGKNPVLHPGDIRVSKGRGSNVSEVLKYCKLRCLSK